MEACLVDVVFWVGNSRFEAVLGDGNLCFFGVAAFTRESLKLGGLLYAVRTGV